jgi:seryl-tRNA synthetase
MDVDNNINWQYLMSAMNFYTSKGFNYTNLDWIVDEEISDRTRPLGKKDFFINNKVLVASAEQSFLQLIKDGKLKPGKYCGITPCFRDEYVLDYLHQQYFMKVELINTEKVDHDSLEEMILIAKEYYAKYLEVEVLKCDEVCDIIDSKHKIELGSYGIRKIDSIDYIFGTGIAEPRLSKVLALQ